MMSAAWSARYFFQDALAGGGDLFHALFFQFAIVQRAGSEIVARAREAREHGLPVGAHGVGERPGVMGAQEIDARLFFEVSLEHHSRIQSGPVPAAIENATPVEYALFVPHRPCVIEVVPAEFFRPGRSHSAPALGRAV